MTPKNTKRAFITCLVGVFAALALIATHHTTAGLIVFFISSPFILFVGAKQQFSKPPQTRPRLTPKLKELNRLVLTCPSGTQVVIEQTDLKPIKQLLKKMSFTHYTIQPQHVYSLTFIDHWDGEWATSLVSDNTHYQITAHQCYAGGPAVDKLGETLINKLRQQTL